MRIARMIKKGAFYVFRIFYLFITIHYNLSNELDLIVPIKSP